MGKLTPEARQRYIESGGVSCPFCGTYNIEAEEVDYFDDCIEQNVSCLDCGEQWLDIYKITDILYEE